MPGQIITFYSYKGGTGRTMALANVAVTLARERRANVLMIDWDLEAPGLHRFFETGARQVDQPGLIDLFLGVRTMLGEYADATPALWAAKRLDRHIAATMVPGLHLMRAGRFDEDYPTKVNTFDWEGLYTAAPETFQSFAEALAERFDYVLIDSRTGITDTSGICTMLLPERLVVVFTPNRQSLIGGLDLVRQAARYRERSDDLRPLVTFPLASRVELSEEDLRNEWRHGSKAPLADGESAVPGYQPSFEALFEDVYDMPDCDLEVYFDEVQVQHAPRFAYGEDVAVLVENSRDRLSVARSYEGFARMLADSDGPWAVKRTGAESPREPFVTANAIADDVSARIAELSDYALMSRRRLLLLRWIEITVAVGVVVGILVTSLSLGSNVYWTTIAASGAALVAVAELVRRVAVGLDGGERLASASSALSRELRLYQASAGPYASAERPAGLLAERAEEVLMELPGTDLAHAQVRARPSDKPATDGPDRDQPEAGPE
jgi:cellulose biosynthesis protein BcsQ